MNAVVAQRLYSRELRVIGLDVNQTAYVFDPSSPTLNRMFEGRGGSVPLDGGYGHTREDYSQLAWGSGGAVWDLGLLRLGGSVTEAFTSAFVEANVREIVAQTETCLNCYCNVQGLSCAEVSTSLCVPPPAVLPSLPESPVTFSFSDELTLRNDHRAVEALDAGQTASLLCEVGQPATLAWTFEGGPLELSLSLVPRELVVSRGCNASIRCQTHELKEGPLSSTLSVLGTSAGNQGLYTCVANSAVRSMSSSSTSFVNMIVFPTDTKFEFKLEINGKRRMSHVFNLLDNNLSLSYAMNHRCLVSDLGSLVQAMRAMRVVVAAARVAAGEVVVGALVPILVPVVGLVQVAVLLLLLLAAAGAVLQLLLLVAVGAALLLLLVAVGAALLVAVGAALLLLLVAVGAALLVAVGAALLLLLVAMGAALLLLLVAMGAALLLLLVAMGAALLLLLLLLLVVGAALLLLAADGRGAALHLTESIETKCKDLVVNITNWSTYS
ncbi:hypothetical protein EMCRGX_G017018 [Ephydatia muelleri]